LSLGRTVVCPTHYDAWTGVPEIGAQVSRFVARCDDWVEAAAKTVDPMPVIEARIASEWWKAIAEEAPQFGGDERRHLEPDVWINSQGLAYAADALRRERAEA